MPNKSSILDWMQFGFIRTLDPINTTGAPRYVITYQFAGTSEPSDWPSSASYTGWTPYTAGEKAAIRAAFDHIETLINVKFKKVVGASDPDINLGKVDLPGATAGVGGPAVAWSGTTVTSYDGTAVYDNTIDISSGQTSLILHELGHALGLKHPFSTPAAPDSFDSNKFSLMSYTANPDNGLDSDAMMLFDIFALQDIWGAASNNTGNNTYTGPRTATIDAIWDSGGLDWLSAAGRSTSVKLDLRAGKFSTFDATDDVVIAYGTKIENAKGGSAGDTLIGNGSKNKMLGQGGNDLLKGGGKIDTIKGGLGNDTLNGQNGNDKLFGNGGNDTIKGGAGKDRIDGGFGDDTIFSQGGADTIIFAKNGGTDVIRDFADNVDTLKLKGFGFTSVGDALGAASDVGGNTEFSMADGSHLTVVGILKADLADDLVIV